MLRIAAILLALVATAAHAEDYTLEDANDAIDRIISGKHELTLSLIARGVPRAHLPAFRNYMVDLYSHDAVRGMLAGHIVEIINSNSLGGSENYERMQNELFARVASFGFERLGMEDQRAALGHLLGFMRQASPDDCASILLLEDLGAASQGLFLELIFAGSPEEVSSYLDLALATLVAEANQTSVLPELNDEQREIALLHLDTAFSEWIDAEGLNSELAAAQSDVIPPNKAFLCRMGLQSLELAQSMEGPIGDLVVRYLMEAE